MILDEQVPEPHSARALARARTRELLLDAAATEFANEGYRGARVERIAERAGVTTGALYDHFGSKAQLFSDACAWASDRSIDDLTVTARAADPRDLAAIASERWMARHRSDPRWFQLRLELVVHPTERPGARQVLAARRDGELARLRQVVEVAVNDRLGAREPGDDGAERLPPADLDELALVIRALANGLLIEELALTRPAPGDADTTPPSALPPGLLGRWVDHLITIATKESP